jgi:opacity protein-like surface antigen
MGPCIDDDTDAWIFMGNLVAPIPIASKWRPYAGAGAGLVYAWIHDAGPYNSDQLHLAMNLGAGVTYWVKDWLGLRADLRYFHVFVDESKPDGGYGTDYDFGRLAVGVTFAMPKRW